MSLHNPVNGIVNICFSLSPATSRLVEQIFCSGADAVRYDVASMTIEDLLTEVERARGAIRKLGIPGKEIFVSLPRTELRLTNSGPISVERGQKFTFCTRDSNINLSDSIVIDCDTLERVIEDGDAVSIGDRAIEFKIRQIAQNNKSFLAEALNDGTIAPSEVLNVRGIEHLDHVSAIHKSGILKHVQALAGCIISIPCVSSRNNLSEIVTLFRKASAGSPSLKLVPNITTISGVKNVPDIIRAPDVHAVMVGKSSLIRVLQPEHVLKAQGIVIMAAKQCQKPIIIETSNPLNGLSLQNDFSDDVYRTVCVGKVDALMVPLPVNKEADVKLTVMTVRSQIRRVQSTEIC